jgi:hypothetical protein
MKLHALRIDRPLRRVLPFTLTLYSEVQTSGFEDNGLPLSPLDPVNPWFQSQQNAENGQQEESHHEGV